MVTALPEPDQLSSAFLGEAGPLSRRPADPLDLLNICQVFCREPAFLLYLRAQTGLTQDELGRLVGVTAGSISRYEMGLRTPNPHTAELLIVTLVRHADFTRPTKLDGAPLLSPEEIAFVRRLLSFIPRRAESIPPESETPPVSGEAIQGTMNADLETETPPTRDPQQPEPQAP